MRTRCRPWHLCPLAAGAGRVQRRQDEAQRGWGCTEIPNSPSAAPQCTHGEPLSEQVDGMTRCQCGDRPVNHGRVPVSSFAIQADALAQSSRRHSSLSLQCVDAQQPCHPVPGKKGVCHYTGRMRLHQLQVRHAPPRQDRPPARLHMPSWAGCCLFGMCTPTSSVTGTPDMLVCSSTHPASLDRIK